jgi:hypothetical protein
MIDPPTDSLYKFIALFGLAILAWGFTFSAPLEADYRIKAAELTANTKIAKSEVDRYSMERDAYRDEQRQVSENSRKWGDLESKKNAVNIKIIKLDNELAIQVAKTDAVSAELERYRYLGPLARLCGALLAAIGFILWYVKVQRHLDSKTANGEESPKPKKLVRPCTPRPKQNRS